MESLFTPEIKSALDLIQAGGFIGLLIILAIPKLRHKFGFKNGSGNKKEDQDTINQRVQSTLKDHAKHLKIANEEMGDIRDSVRNIEKDMSEMKNKQGNIETDLSWIKDKLK